MREEWKSLKAYGFPHHSVSSTGIVCNEKTGRFLAQTKNQQGLMKVSLYHQKTKVRTTVQVSRLVAESFVPGQSSLNNTPIHLNGNKEHTFADNLVWRPRWFAVLYHSQFKQPVRVDRKIRNLNTKEIFLDSRRAATRYGNLEKHIQLDLVNKTGVFPQGYKYELV